MSGRWRELNLLALSGLHVWCTALGAQAQWVSYPLYRSVPPSDFGAYHAAYDEAIPLPVVVPGFVTFLGAAAFAWTRPSHVPRRQSAVVAAAGVVSLLSTVLWAIPRHDQLDRDGSSAATIDSLLRANLVRLAALAVGTAVLGRCLRRRLLDRR